MSQSKPPVCPKCGRPKIRQFRPFCSRRCRDDDLAHWIKGDYAIPIIEENGADIEE